MRYFFLKQDMSKSRSLINSDRGVVLLIVLVLSGIALAIMTAVIYMITTGVQISRMQKGYKTALDAGFGGWEMVNQIVGTRAHSGDTAALFKTMTDSFAMNAGTPLVLETCTGIYTGVPYKGLQAKVLTPASSWSAACNKSISIDPNDATTYDMKFELGSGTKYTVYAKIVNTIEGNTGGDSSGELLDTGGVVNSSATIKPMTMPYLYTIEVNAENSQNPSERAKLSVLYEY